MSAAPAMPGLDVDRGASRDDLARFLSEDRLFAAYALADLDEANVSGARWWVARRGEAPVAAALAMVDLSFRPLFLCGEAQGAAALLRQAVREPRVIVAAPPEHRPAIEEVYRLERVDRMLRMVVDTKRLRRVRLEGAVRLRPEHLDAVIDLYGLASRSYFTPRRIEREVYYGIFENDALVAAAGTHVRSTEFGLAAIGNVLTRVAYRNRGYATVCTAAVAEACLGDHPDIVLNVREDNEPAIAVYRRLGFRVHRPFIESVGYRRVGLRSVVKSLFKGASPNV
jgi:RimJ/RimL family protein N-acetyltransferase